MKKTLSKIVGYFSIEKIKNDRRIIAFSVCLFIATALWFLNAMSKNYVTTVTYPVKFIEPPENMFMTSTPPKRFLLKVEAHGFSLLRHKLTLSTSPLVFNLKTIWENNGKNQNNFTIQTQQLREQITDQVSNEITVSDITPKVISFVFDSLATKTVPVKANIQTVFKPQFYLNGLIGFEPESIRISGPASILDTIRFLKTEFHKITDIDATIEKPVRILHPENTNIAKKTVTLKIPVERYTEKEIYLPVEVKNKPEDATIKLFPSEVQISFLVGMSEYENITAADFKAFVDYSQTSDDSETLEVKIESKPPFIQMLRISPQSIEFLIETN